MENVDFNRIIILLDPVFLLLAGQFARVQAPNVAFRFANKKADWKTFR